MAENKINFTKASLDALPLPAAGQRMAYHDAKTNGLQIRVTSTGVKTFCVFRRVKAGSPERVTLGRYPDMSIEQARKEAARINSLIADGINPNTDARALKTETTLQELFGWTPEQMSSMEGCLLISPSPIDARSGTVIRFSVPPNESGERLHDGFR